MRAMAAEVGEGGGVRMGPGSVDGARPGKGRRSFSRAVDEGTKFGAGRERGRKTKGSATGLSLPEAVGGMSAGAVHVGRSGSSVDFAVSGPTGAVDVLAARTVAVPSAETVVVPSDRVARATLRVPNTVEATFEGRAGQVGRVDVASKVSPLATARLVGELGSLGWTVREERPAVRRRLTELDVERGGGGGRGRRRGDEGLGEHGV